MRGAAKVGSQWRVNREELVAWLNSGGDAELRMAFSALQILSEMADEELTAVVRIRARSSKPIDRNLYEMSVLMPLDEEDIEVIE